MSSIVPVKPTIDIDVNQERNKPRLLSLLFCDFINFTNENKANLIGIFDRIYVHPQKKVTPEFVLYIRSLETRQEGLKVRIWTPDGTPAIAIDFEDFDPNLLSLDLPANVQSTLRLQFHTPQEGVYWVNVFYKDESLGGAGLVVEFRETKETQGGTDTYV